MMLPVVAGVLVALTLSGCGSTPAPAPTPAPVLNRLVGGAWQTLRVDHYDTLANLMPSCSLWSPDDGVTKVPDECCELSKWPSQAMAVPNERTMIHENQMHTCFVEDAKLSNADMEGPLQTRNYLGCEDGELIGGTTCVPDGVALSSAAEVLRYEYPHGYPMNTTFSATAWENGTFDSCQCSNKSNFEKPARLAGGAGCYASLKSFYQLGFF